MKVIHVNLIGENIKKIMFYWRVKFEQQVRKKTVVRLSITNKQKEKKEERWVIWAKYSRMDQVKCFKGCLPQILPGPFVNTLSHIILL